MTESLFNKTLFNFNKKVIPTQVFSCECCERLLLNFKRIIPYIPIYFFIVKISYDIFIRELLTFDLLFQKLSYIKSILIHEYQHKSTQVNTNQHESKTSRINIGI